MNLKSRVISWFIASLIPISLLIEPTYSDKITIPPRCRTEGRITLSYEQGDQTSDHHLAFTESIDSIALKSAVSVGYVSYNPSRYYVVKGNPAIKVDTDGRCSSLEKGLTLVPEISWLLDLMLPGVDLEKYKAPTTNFHFVGPTELLSLFMNILRSSDLNDIQFDPIYKVTHRNIQCNVYAKTIQLPGKDFKIHLEILMPYKGIVFRNIENTYFSVKAKTVFTDPKATVKSASFAIDFFNIELMNDQAKLERFQEDFNVPLGKGCSAFLKSIQPEVKSYTFSMDYTQQSSSASKLLAYDHLANFMRKEDVGVSVRIWDLSEDLLFYINTNVSQSIGDQKINHERATCSVLEVDDSKLGPAYRPCDKVPETLSVSVLRMIGADKVAYMGLGSIRDLPCFIYETILTEPPIIFALTEEQLMRQSAIERDYIVQYYLLRGDNVKPDETLNDEAFFPARINLFRRTISTGAVELIDQLDIFEFFWSLDGWNKKGVELFMASECFDDEAEQLRFELAVVFDKLHGYEADEDDKNLLAYNKYNLEYDLINNVLELLSIRRTHLIQYELKLRPNHVGLSMVIADRKDSKDLRYFGTGQLPDKDSYAKSRVVMTDLDEESCVSVSSLLDDISLVVYCPSQAQDKGSSCVAVYGESEPAVKSFISTNPNIADCQVYIFDTGVEPHRATYRLMMNKFQLYGHKMDFVAKVPGSKGKDTRMLSGTIKDYEISHEVQLLTVDHYTFAIDSTNDKSSGSVRSFDSISYNNIGDCIKICNLDATCRSYSYCTSKTESNQCTLSNLDIRTTNIQDQLVHAPSPIASDNGDKIVTVVGNRGKKFALQFKDRCDIYERDYLNMFRQTDEIIRLPLATIHQFQTAPSTFDCAKQSVDLELSFDDHHVAMFAYCGSENLCILDEALFSKTFTTSRDKEVSNNGDREIICTVYRKKYQTYFDVSGKVLAQTAHSDQQVQLESNTVEECARACWNHFGQVCASFDFCSPGACLINQLGTKSANVELETKPSCLHYERDLKWDELRKQHMIGRQSILDWHGKSVRTWGEFFLNLFTYTIVIGSFIYGLMIGRQVSDKLEAVTIMRQSISYGRGARGSSRFFGNARGSVSVDNDDDDTGGEGGGRGIDDLPMDSILEASDETFSNNAIRMDVIKHEKKVEREVDLLDQ